MPLGEFGLTVALGLIIGLLGAISEGVLFREPKSLWSAELYLRFGRSPLALWWREYWLSRGPIDNWGQCNFFAARTLIGKRNVTLTPFTIAQILYVGLVTCFVIGTSIKAALIFILVMALIMPSIALLTGIATLPRKAG